jgi:hypothetical protein
VPSLRYCAVNKVAADRLCVVDKRRAGNGMLVCNACARGMGRNLASLPMLWQELLALHIAVGTGQHISGTPERAVPYRDAVGDERQRIAAALLRWCAYVTHRTRTAPANQLPASTAAFLHRHLSRLCNDAKVGALANELTERRARATALVYPTGQRRFGITMPDGSPARCLDCGAPLRATIRTDTDLLPSAISCTGCSTSIPASLWVTWARQTRRLGAGWTLEERHG